MASSERLDAAVAVGNSNHQSASAQLLNTTSRRRSLRVKVVDCLASTVSSSRGHSIDDEDSDEDLLVCPSSDVSQGKDLHESLSSTATTARYNGTSGSSRNSKAEYSFTGKQESCRTDYTYAKSFIYSSNVTPSRPCPAPIMSRQNLPYRLFAEDDHAVEAKTTTKSSLLSRIFGWVYRFGDESSLSEHQNGSVNQSKSHIVRYNYGLDSESDEDQVFKSSSVHNTSFTEWLLQLFSSSVQVISTSSSLVKYNSFFLCIYKFISWLLLFDVWLLTRLRSWRRFWLLFPLLLLLIGGLWLGKDSFDERIRFPLFTFDDASQVGTLFFNRTREFASDFAVGLWSLPFLGLFESTWSSSSSSLRQERSESRMVDVVPASIRDEIALMKRCLYDDTKYCGESNSGLQEIILRLETKVKQLEEKYESQLGAQQNSCSNHSEDGALVKHYVALALNEIFANGESAGDEDDGSVQGRYEVLQNWINRIFVFREKTANDVDNMRIELKDTLRSELRAEIVALMGLMKNTEQVQHETTAVNNDAVTEQWVKNFFREAMMLYSADKTGMADFAHESGGGSVVSTRCTVTHDPQPGEISVFGFSVGYVRKSPRLAIQSGVLPGECWSFKGSNGYLVIKLSATIKPQAFSLEHIPRSLSTTGNIDSAPREFSVWGLNDASDLNKVLLGRYTYDQHGDALQLFIVKDPDVGSFGFVELEIHSNHGNPEYTCLYRFRVHGILHST